MTFFLMFLGALALIGFVMWRRKKAREAPMLWDGHLTGVASPYRTPARFFHNRRTL